MLRLNDPLWTKLDNAHRDRDIPALLRSLAQTWNDDAANSLFYDCLCHQGTCYGATYAAIPHLIDIAQRPDHKHQCLEITFFLAFVALNALRIQENDYADSPGVLPNGLPKTRDEWDRKLSYFDVPSMDVGDLRKIERIRKDFFATLPTTRELCERAFLENLEDDSNLYLLSGVAAADRLVALADLLEGETRETSDAHPAVGVITITSLRLDSPSIKGTTSDEDAALKTSRKVRRHAATASSTQPPTATPWTLLSRRCSRSRCVREAHARLCCCAISWAPSAAFAAAHAG